MTRAAKFKESDVRRAVKAVRAAGVEIASVDFAPGGVFKVIPLNGAARNELDRELEEFEARHDAALKDYEVPGDED